MDNIEPATPVEMIEVNTGPQGQACVRIRVRGKWSTLVETHEPTEQVIHNAGIEACVRRTR